MAYSPILIGHICAGSLGLLSGTAAMSFRKGSPRHQLGGFVAHGLKPALSLAPGGPFGFLRFRIPGRMYFRVSAESQKQ